MWTLDDGSMSRLFSKALPIADGDHAMHHVTLPFSTSMTVTPVQYDM